MASTDFGTWKKKKSPSPYLRPTFIDDVAIYKFIIYLISQKQIDSILQYLCLWKNCCLLCKFFTIFLIIFTYHFGCLMIFFLGQLLKNTTRLQWRYEKKKDVATIHHNPSQVDSHSCKKTHQNLLLVSVVLKCLKKFMYFTTQVLN